MKFRCVILFMVLILSTNALAETGSPIQALEGPINQIIFILNDKQYDSPDAKTKQREKMWELVYQIFDFSEISRRSLAVHWKRFTEAQKEAFKDAFTRLLGDTYLNRIQGGYTKERVEFIKEDQDSGNRVVVKTKIIGTGREILIHYSMFPTDKGWRIYDVSIEGVSLVQNYRQQFQKILLKSSPEQLIDQIRNKRTKSEKASAKRSVRK